MKPCPAFLRTVWSGGYALLYNAPRLGNQYVEAWMAGMRERSIAVGFLFLICMLVTWMRWPTSALADERGPLWGLAERICASGETPAGINSEDFPLHGIGAADQPVRLIQEAELVEGRQRVRGILMLVAQCPDNKPMAGATRPATRSRSCMRRSMRAMRSHSNALRSTSACAKSFRRKRHSG
jgi:hypothetical protein